MIANKLNIHLFLILFCFQLGTAQELTENKKSINTQLKDSLTEKKVIPLIKKDTMTSDTTKVSKEVIKNIITHNAEDYTLQNAKNKTITLYNKAYIKYGDIDLKAGKITIDYKKNTVYATGIKDNTKTKYIQRPVFKQGNYETQQDSILFNFKTKKALVYGVKNKYGEMITYGKKMKRVNDSTIYMSNLKFTTSKKTNPDYYISTKKAKLIPNKKIIVGGSQLYIADVPTPVYLPFAYFPLTKKRSSGFLIPSWGENNNQGFFLQNGGYYFAINDYFDLKVTGDIYSNGSWGLNTESNYVVRYKYSGRLSFRYQNLTNSLVGFDDYSKATNYNISWSHSQDSKSNPNSRLSASVNLGSSKFYRQSINEIDQSQYLTNTLTSSINYYRKFVGTPFNMNVSMTHSQNSNTGEINMTLPSLTVNMDRIYPFKGKGGVKRNAFQKIGVNYNMRGEYRINTNDDEFFSSKMFNTARTGIQHNISANTNVKAFKYFTLSPNLNYRDVWYFDKIEKHYSPNIVNNNGSLGTVVNDTISGFKRFNEYNVGVTLSTTVYGTFNFKKGRIKAIRHTLIPNISWGYRPDFSKKHNIEIQRSSNPNDILTYSPFENGIYGTPSSGLSNSIGISLNNVVEAKVKEKDINSEKEYKRVTILNNFNLSTSYNFAADSLRWSNVNFSAGIPIVKNKLNLNVNGYLDPYQVTQKGVRINKFNKNILSLRQISLTTNYSISSADLKKKSKNSQTENQDNNNPPDILGTKINPTNGFASRATNNNKSSKKDIKLYHANIPWSINLGYSISYYNNGYSIDEIQNHTLDFSGNIELSPKWKIGFRSGYDIKAGAFSYTTLNFSRDLDSWRFNFNWIPFGNRTSYHFFIGVKSSLLSDLKWDKTKPPDKRLF
ncbi:MAG: LPS-assembly protein LptD [Tenacibaculum sp.]|nr:LPS-assembly protein LptD [Tenacibaculum sp.]